MFPWELLSFFFFFVLLEGNGLFRLYILNHNLPREAKAGMWCRGHGEERAAYWIASSVGVLVSWSACLACSVFLLSFSFFI